MVMEKKDGRLKWSLCFSGFVDLFVVIMELLEIRSIRSFPLAFKLPKCFGVKDRRSRVGKKPTRFEACLGYIVPEYYRWPGDLSPSLGLKLLGEVDDLTGVKST